VRDIRVVVRLVTQSKAFLVLCDFFTFIQMPPLIKMIK